MLKPKIVKEWFIKGHNDILNAEFLFEGDRDLETVAFHIHQAAEKYLKGFLISKGKELEMLHDLVKLLHDVAAIDAEFKQFNEAARQITNFYFESRYPMGYDAGYTRKEITEAIKWVKALIALIEEKAK